MTPVAKWIRDLAERWLARRYEGPEPPDRLRVEVESFAQFRPRAARREWIEFATAFARECYRVGYVRGFEWAERDFSGPGERPADPDALMDALDPGWREWSPSVRLDAAALDEVVPEEIDPLELLRATAERR